MRRPKWTLNWSTCCFGSAEFVLQDLDFHFRAPNVGFRFLFPPPPPRDSAAGDSQIGVKWHFFQNSVPIILSSSKKSIYGTSQSCCQRAQPLPKPSRNNKECSMCFLKRRVKFVYERSNPGTSPGSLHTERLVLFLLYNFTALSPFRFPPFLP